MCKEKVVFLVDSFTDFSGDERMVTFCGISQDIKGYCEIFDTDNIIGLERVVHIGVAVQSPSEEDAANLPLAKIIAEGKARKEKSRIGSIFVTTKKLVSRDIVDSVLEQQMTFFKENPGVFIKGYDRDKKLYENNPSEYFNKFNL